MVSPRPSTKRPASDLSCTNDNESEDHNDGPMVQLHPRHKTLDSSENESLLNTDNGSERYKLLVSVLRKSFTQSRQKIANDARSIITDCYGDVTSLFASANDDEGVDTLAGLLMGTLDKVHDQLYSPHANSPSKNFSSSLLEKILRDHNIPELLQRLEQSIDKVEKEELEFKEMEERDKLSAKEAVDKARLPLMNKIQERSTGREEERVVDKNRTKKIVIPGEYIGYHAYQFKNQHHNILLENIKKIEEENNELERKLKEKWEIWNQRVNGVESVLNLLDNLARGKASMKNVMELGVGQKDNNKRDDAIMDNVSVRE